MHGIESIKAHVLLSMHDLNKSIKASCQDEPVCLISKQHKCMKMHDIFRFLNKQTKLISNKQTDNHNRQIRQCVVIVIGPVSCLASLHTHLWRLFTLFISRIHKSKTELRSVNESGYENESDVRGLRQNPHSQNNQSQTETKRVRATITAQTHP